MVIGNDVQNWPESVLRLSRSIRFCEVIDKTGRIVAGKTRSNARLLVTDEENHRLALHSAMRHFTMPTWAKSLGQMYYSMGRYEKVIGAVIPVGDKFLLIVSFDHDTNKFDKIIMNQILPITEDLVLSRD